MADEALAPGTSLHIGTNRRELDVSCDDDSQLLLIGCEPFVEEVLMQLNSIFACPAERAETYSPQGSRNLCKACVD